MFRAEDIAMVTARVLMGEVLAMGAPARLAMPLVPSQRQSMKVAPGARDWENSTAVRSQRRKTVPVRSAETKSAFCRRQSVNSTLVNLAKRNELKSRTES